jgi:hypothetical protein
VTRWLLALACLAWPLPALAWTATLQECLLRDARRLIPRTLARLMNEREPQILEELRRFPQPLGHSLATDLSTGSLRPATLAALESHTAEALLLFKQQRVSEGVVRLAATLRIPADLSDPVLTAGAQGYPSGVTREYYAFVEASLDKLPVVLADASALELRRSDLPGYWNGLLRDSRRQSPLIRSELFKRGRVVDHRSVDYRSPVFGVAQISYSRAVTAIAATWLAVWREARGDLTRQPEPRVVVPRDAPPLATAVPPPEAHP